MIRMSDVNSMFSMLCSGFYDSHGFPQTKYIVEQESRNGKVKSHIAPVVIHITDPRKRVLFHPQRHANPVFHLMEALWMLAGRDDVAFVRQFNQQMYTYSDDGVRFNAAYGFRWRNHFGYDQVARAISMLKANPADRRVVIAMWDPQIDLGSASLDIPCNTQLMFRMHNGRLNLTSTNRSNDLIWGLMGANCVHLTILQEFIASAVGVPVGEWYHFTNNLHIYEHHYALVDKVAKEKFYWPDYPPPAKLVKDPDQFLKECNELCDGKLDFFEEPFFDGTVAPMIQSWHAWKAGDSQQALEDASCIDADDWRKGTVEWYQRSIQRKNSQ